MSLAVAASPVCAAQRSVAVVNGASGAGVVLPQIPALTTLPSVQNLPAVSLPQATLPAVPTLPANAVAPAAIRAQAQEPGAQQPAAPVEPQAAVPSEAEQRKPALSAVQEAAAAVEQKPDQAPAALSNLYGDRASSAEPWVSPSAAKQEKTDLVGRLERWVKRPAVKTAGSLIAAASPLLILAAKTTQAAAPIVSNMDPNWTATVVSQPSHLPVQLAAAFGAAVGAVAGAVLTRAGAKRLEGNKPVHGAALMLGSIVAAGVVTFAAATIASFSPLAAAASLSAVILAGAAQADLIAPFTRWRESRKRQPGLFDVVREKDDTYLDLKPSQLGRLHMLSGTVERGLGENNLATNTQWDFEFAFYLRRAGDRVELVRKNTLFRAPEGSALHKTISRGVPDSVIASAPLKEVDGRLRVDASKLFVEDFFGLGAEVDWGYGFDYSMDEKLSGLEDVKAFPRNLEIKSRLTFLRGDSEHTKTHLGDTRRIDLGVRYSLSALPEAGYRPRKATPLIGHFSTVFEDWTDDQKPDLETYLIQRWRLEKSDPSQAASPVKKPVVFWIDQTIPKEYRAAVARGALKWNKAFEKIGLLGAIEVREVGDGDDFDPTDIRHNMISYRFERDSPFALGNSRANPLTGEIYHAHVTIVPEHARSALQLRFKELETLTVDASEGKKAEGKKHVHERGCHRAQQLADEASMTMSILEARGELTEDSKRRLIEAYMEDLVMHEIGHTLGLRHNFVAKSWLPLGQAGENGVLSASVMDYYPMSLSPKGEPQLAFAQSDIGPYDYLAIEYAYKPLDPATEDAELAKIAARTAEPGLEYLTDEDASGVDPRAQHNTLGDDVVKWAERRAALTREMWEILEAKAAAGALDHQSAYRRWLQTWLGYDMGSKQAVALVGGIYFHRTAAGVPTGRASYEPVPAADQRRALEFLAKNVFSDEPFAISPELLRSIAKRREGPAIDRGDGADLTHFSHDALVARLRAGVLDMLLDEGRLKRLADSAKLLKPGEERLSVLEVFGSVVEASFGELSSRARKKGSRTVSAMRRALQDRVVTELLGLIDEDNGWGPELRVPAREALIALQRKLGSALKSRAWDAESRAHLTELSRLVKKGLTPNKV